MEKKSLVFRFFALALAIACSLGANAYDFVSGGVYYNITGTNTVEVTTNNPDGFSYFSPVTVPSTVTYGSKTYTVTRVGKNAFRLCQIVTSVDLPPTITEIDTSAFYGTQSLKRIIIPEGVRRIARYNFYENDSLTTVVLPSALQNIEDMCFYRCPKLSSVTCLATVPPYTDGTFFGLLSSCVLFVPMNSVDTYSVANDWKKFTDIRSIFITSMKPGDMNEDGNVNVADVASLINYLLNDQK